MSERQKTNSACEWCRKSKRKCSGEKPSCRHCRNQSKTCSYAPRADSFRRTHKDQQNYIRLLEAENASLSALLKTHAQESSKEKLSSANHVRNSIDLPIAEQESDSTRQETPRPVMSAAQELGDLVWAIKPDAEGNMSFTGPSGTLNFPASSNRATIFSKSTETKSTERHSDFLAYANDETLKSSLVNLFMEFINPTSQFLTEDPLPMVTSLLRETPSIQLLCSAVLAAATCYSDSEDALRQREAFDFFSENLLFYCIKHDPGLHTLRAVTILAWKELHLGQQTTGWLYLCIAGGISQHLGLHVMDLQQHTEDVSPSQQMDNVRAFWAYAWVDRMATAALGRASTIPWSVFATPTFSSVSSRRDLTIGEIFFDHICKLWRIHDNHMANIYHKDFRRTDAETRKLLLANAVHELGQFRLSIDSTLNVDLRRSDNTLMSMWFQISLETAMSSVHRPFLRFPSDTAYQLVLNNTTAAANKISQIIQRHRRSCLFTNAPPFMVYHIFRAAVLHLLNTTSTDQQVKRQSAGMLRTCIAALEDFSTRWSVLAGRVIRALQELAERWQVVWALPMKWSYPLDIDTMGNEGSGVPVVDAEEPEGRVEQIQFAEEEGPVLQDYSVSEHWDSWCSDEYMAASDYLFDFSTFTESRC